VDDHLLNLLHKRKKNINYLGGKKKRKKPDFCTVGKLSMSRVLRR
jgi:hypothetical protein